jgi:hypothetical protein
MVRASDGFGSVVTQSPELFLEVPDRRLVTVTVVDNGLGGCLLFGLEATQWTAGGTEL